MSPGDIFSWKRGGTLEKYCEASSPLMPLIRLTIDFDGISSMEHISDQPSNEVSSVSFRYIVEQKKTTAKFSAQFKNGFLRLVLPTGQPTPRIWNSTMDLWNCHRLDGILNFWFTSAREVSTSSNRF
ncbi:uncharacterized protein F4812DRAFT_462541 [Daldinia caldariorum]|uniref:uncharacterized protein n=1 Tax=Daldinia caldariorum TaxID=326644 RepID=UPI0020085C51|nr:uncharacterized protein F4812DRAFT_462541 [Daldinia caldariorum]KAI1464483.1 hypothetical protein F4812DRAFT_462541 [Daldinia caldariorum]